MQFSFSEHALDTDRRELRRGSDPIAVEPQVFDLLVYLLQNRDRVVSKDDLIAAVWGGRIVSDSTLTSRINAARKAIGDSGEQQKLIRTVARKGLRFVGAVTVHSHGSRPDSRGAVPTSLDRRSGSAALDAAPNGSTRNCGAPLHQYERRSRAGVLFRRHHRRHHHGTIQATLVLCDRAQLVLHLQGSAVHIRQIADEVGVGYVVEGSVRKGGDRVRITAQLNDVATGSHIWAERYDRKLADVFAVQDEITEAIVAAIEPQSMPRRIFVRGASRRTPWTPGIW